MNKIELKVKKLILDLKNLPTLLMLICTVLLCASPCRGETEQDLTDQNLSREFDWVMFVEAHALKQYLNYRGSQLYPLTKVRIKFRFAPRGGNTDNAQTRVYEELWYYRGKPVGLKRYLRLDIEENRMGAVVIAESRDDDKTDYSAAETNALVRLIVDLQFKRDIVSVVSVPKDQYDDIATALGRFGFWPEMVKEGQQLSIHLQSNPGGKDEYYFYQRKY